MARVVVNKNIRRDYQRAENHRDWSDAAARTGKAAIQAVAPRETGLLKMTFRTRAFLGDRGMPTVRYEAVPDYAIFPEVGTGIYGPLGKYITPKRAKMLSWISSTTGQRVYAKRVRGQKPQRYFKRGLEATFGKRNVRYYGASKINVTGRGV